MDTTEGLVVEVNKEMSERYKKENKEYTDINYVYVPEGSKTFALWWTVEKWLPKLVKEFGDKFKFEYLVMIDNDVPLPDPVNDDEYFDFKAMTGESTNTVGVAYTIKAVPKDPDSEGCWGKWLVSMQDAEYKLSGFTKLFQSKMGSAFYAHGAVSLWNVDVLKERILLHHDTEFHGEDMYMGLLLHRENSPSRLPWESKKSHALGKIKVGSPKRWWPASWVEKLCPSMAACCWDYNAKKDMRKFIKDKISS